MPVNHSVLSIPLNGTGVEIPTLNVTDPYEEYEITGTAVIAVGNYAIVATGTPVSGTTFIFNYEATLDITTNTKTFAIFGTSLTQTQLNCKLTITCRYTGSAWKTKIVGSLDQANIDATNLVDASIDTSDLKDASVTTAKLASNAVTAVKVTNNTLTNAKLAQMANLTIKGNISGGTANAADIPLTSITPYYAWSITGNSGLTAGTNFIGTTDSVALVFKANNYESGRINLTHSSTSFGFKSLLNNANDFNTAFGELALTLNSTGYSNTAIGSNSFAIVTTGINNTAIGDESGSNLTTGSGNTLIGQSSSTSTNSALHRIALGFQAQATLDYQFAIPTDITTVEFGAAQLTCGANIQKLTPTAANATVTLTAAQVKTGYITSTSAAATALTLPSGVLLGASLGASQGTTHLLYIDNTAGASTVTIVASAGGVLAALGVANAASSGLLTFPVGATGVGCIRIVFTSATSFVFTRVA